MVENVILNAVATSETCRLIQSHYKYLLPRRAKVAYETEAGTGLSFVWLSSNWTVLTQVNDSTSIY
ncbi:unnamed protein product [Rhodiola kirilowii]